jgi:hypothetical protein
MYEKPEIGGGVYFRKKELSLIKKTLTLRKRVRKFMSM